MKCIINQQNEMKTGNIIPIISEMDGKGEESDSKSVLLQTLTR
jgi:hypothetical protein